MALVTSQFDKNDKSVSALAARNTVLNKEIEAQKGKVETLKSALDNAVTSFGENDRRTQNWQIQLNKAQAELNGMERELAANNKELEAAAKGFDEAGNEADAFGRGMGEAGKEAGGLGDSLGDTGKKMSDAEREAAGLGASLSDAGKEINDTGKETSSLGKEMEDVTGKTSIFGDVLKANLAADAISAGARALVDMVKSVGAAVKGYIDDGSRMASDAAQNQAKLTHVMRNTMDASDAQIKSIKRLTEEHQRLGIVSATAQLGGAQELATYLAKTDTLENLIPVMNDMVAQQYGINASQESAVNIATMLGKVMNDQVGALSRYGYTFDEAQDWLHIANSRLRDKAAGVAHSKPTDHNNRYSCGNPSDSRRADGGNCRQH